MSLTRAEIPPASRIMVPAYPVLAAILGLNYLTASDRLVEQTAVLDTAAAIMPLPAWGLLFLAVALVQVAAMLTHRRTAYLRALAVMCGAMVVWTLIFAAGVLYAGGSPAAPAWPGVVAVSCVASMRSLITQEVR